MASRDVIALGRFGLASEDPMAKPLALVDVEFGGQGGALRRAVALIDTGAEHCLVDEGLARDLPVLRTVPTYSTSGVSLSNVVVGQLVIGRAIHSGEFAVGRLRQGGAPHDFIVGMDFLAGTRLEICHRDGTVRISEP